MTAPHGAARENRPGRGHPSGDARVASWTGAIVLCALLTGLAGCVSNGPVSPPVVAPAAVDPAPVAPDTTLHGVTADPSTASASEPTSAAPVVRGPDASNATIDPEPITETRTPDSASGSAVAPGGARSLAKTEIIAADPALLLEGRVVLGVRRTARTGAVLDICRCFQVIPAFQRIRREEMPRTRADYHFLMAQATEQFEDAVEAVAFREGVDLVIGVDKNVEIPAGTRDLTEDVVAELRGGR